MEINPVAVIMGTTLKSSNGVEGEEKQGPKFI